MPAEALAPASCASCGLHQCHFNVERSLDHVALDRQAWLLDEVWPEFNAHLLQSGEGSPLAFLPWGGRLPRRAAYAWQLPDCARSHITPLLSLRRSWAMRHLKPQGARRQQVLEDFDRHYARVYGDRLPPTVTRLVVWQNFLPFLHMDKTLGGRNYEVLLWRAPRHVLHGILAEASLRYPESETLKDFRSCPATVEAERRALEEAAQIVTPHTQLARLYPHKTKLLDWSKPVNRAGKLAGKKIGFPGPTVGRRGSYVMREAMKKLQMSFVALGRNLERETFWDGTRVEERLFAPDWLDDLGLVVAPALTEYKPRLILQALARGIPVIATPACGLPPQENLHFVDPFDENALAEKIEVLKPR
jgi:hypothetical protein